MNHERIAKMAEKVAGEFEDEALSLVDQAIDMMIRSAKIINENLPKVKVTSVPQKAALDTMKETMEGVAPYLADVAKAMQAFEGGE